MGKNGNTVEYTVGICHRGEWVKKTAKAAVASGWQPSMCGGFFREKRGVREEFSRGCECYWRPRWQSRLLPLSGFRQSRKWECPGLSA